MRPRSASLSADIWRPASQTSPLVGVSRPPSMFSSVVLPEPELPTMATRSPACSRRSTFCSTCRLWGPTAYSLLRLRHSNTTSVITKCLRRLCSGCASGQIQICKETYAQGRATDYNHMGPVELSRQIGGKVSIRAGKLDGHKVFKPGDQGRHVEGRQYHQSLPNPGADHTDYR